MVNTVRILYYKPELPTRSVSPRISVLKGHVQASEKQLLTLVVQDSVILYFSGKRSMSYQEEYQEVVLYEAMILRLVFRAIIIEGTS